MILLVENEIKMTNEICSGLKDKGYSTETINDADSVISSFKSGKYDLMILDLEMPETDGFGLYEKIRDMDDKIKICFLTGSKRHNEEFLTLFPIWEAKNFFYKPVVINELINHVKETIEDN